MTVPDPREVKRVVDALVEAENQILRLRAEYSLLFNQNDREEDAGKRTIGERILDLLTNQYSETFSAQQVANALEAKLSSVGPNLSRLVAERKIRKVGHGEYRGLTPDLPWISKNPLLQDKEDDPSDLTN